MHLLPYPYEFCEVSEMADLLPFLFAQIDKIFENFVRPEEYLKHQ